MTRSKTGLNSPNKLGAQVWRYAISPPRMGAGVRLAFCDMGQGQPPLQASPAIHSKQKSQLFLSYEPFLEKEMAAHFSTLA